MPDAELTEWSCWTEHCSGEVVGKYRVADVAAAPFDAWLCLTCSAGREWVEGTPLPDLDRPSTDEGTALPTREQVKAALDFVLATAASLARCDPFHGADSDNVSDRTIENFGRLGTRLMEARETLRMALLSHPDTGFIVSATRPDPAPGRIAIHRSGSVARLGHRKDDDSGWWLIGGVGGLSDWALAQDGWVLPTDLELSQLFDAIQAGAPSDPVRKVLDAVARLASGDGCPICERNTAEGQAHDRDCSLILALSAREE